MTPQRQLVLDAVSSLGHATPDEVLARVRAGVAGRQRLDGLPDPRAPRGARAWSGTATSAPVRRRGTPPRTPGTCTCVPLVRRCHGGAGLASPTSWWEVWRRCTGFKPDMEHFAVQGTCADCLAAGGVMTPGTVVASWRPGPDAGQPWHFGDPLREQRTSPPAAVLSTCRTAGWSGSTALTGSAGCTR